MSESFFPDTPEASASQTAVPRSGGSLDPGLSGPGIPGRRISPYPSSSEEYPRPAPASPELPAATARRSSDLVTQEFPSLTLREPTPRVLAPRPFSMHENEHSPPSSRVLPPIYSSALESRLSTDPCMVSTSSSRLSHSSASIMHHQEPASDHTGHYSISAALGIPPPFALQPQPQWDLQSFTPFTRPDFRSFSPSATRGNLSVSGTSDRSSPHVSPASARRRDYLSSGERLLPSSSHARSYTPRDMVDPSPQLAPTRSRHLPSSSLSRLDTYRNPREYPSHQPSSTDDRGMHSDDDEPYRGH